MEEISKKDLLKITGISYGQLYRWKRMGLIPEDWFIKRASFTGQETYFPKDLILERIDKILELKDDVSLEDLSDIINNNKFKDQFKKQDLLNKHIFVNHELVHLVKSDYLDFPEIVILKVLDNVVDSSLELKKLYDYLLEIKDDLINHSLIYLIPYNNEVGCILVKDEMTYDFNLTNTIKVKINSIIDNLKLVLLV